MRPGRCTRQGGDWPPTGWGGPDGITCLGLVSGGCSQTLRSHSHCRLRPHLPEWWPRAVETGVVGSRDLIWRPPCPSRLFASTCFASSARPWPIRRPRHSRRIVRAEQEEPVPRLVLAPLQSPGRSVTQMDLYCTKYPNSNGWGSSGSMPTPFTKTPALCPSSISGNTAAPVTGSMHRPSPLILPVESIRSASL